MAQEDIFVQTSKNVSQRHKESIPGVISLTCTSLERLKIYFIVTHMLTEPSVPIEAMKASRSWFKIMFKRQLDMFS